MSNQKTIITRKVRSTIIQTQLLATMAILVISLIASETAIKLSKLINK